MCREAPKDIQSTDADAATRDIMTQRSVLAQTSLPEHKQTRLNYKWMKYFFNAEDSSPGSHSIVELQRRAVWIALALILQSLNEIEHSWYFPFISPFGSLIPLALFLASFWALWMGLRPAPEKATSTGTPTRKQPKLWQRVILLLTVVLAIIGATQFGRAIYMSFQQPEFSNDGTSLDTNAAILLVQGRNPYTDSNIPELLRRFDIKPYWTTPLRQGQFADRIDYPSMVEIQSVLNTSLRADTVPEFEEKVSYPALSFLTLVPFALIGNYNVLPFYLLSYLLLIAIAWKVARTEIRPWVLLLAVANIPMWASTVGGNLDVFYTLLLVVSWIKRDQVWPSAVFLGLALATKQIAWFFVPYYLIMAYQHYGFKSTCQRLAIAGALALVINLPFIMWNPYAWYAGVMAPIKDPMFPMGVGIVGLSTTHLLPYLPSWVYSALEGVGILLSLLTYWRVCRKSPESALLFAVMPLFLAWRSLSSYFYCVAFPVYVFMVARNVHATQKVLSFIREHTPAARMKNMTSPLRVS